LETLICGSVMADTDEYIIDEDLPPDVLMTIGQITTTWAQFDAFVSAAFFSILNIDSVEFGIIIGRTESPAKLSKMHQIFKHWGESTKAKVMKDAKDLTEDLRPLRNTLTHGRYIGRSTKEEFFFILPVDFMIEESTPTANEMVVVTRSDLVLHLKRLISVFGRTMQEFDHAKMGPFFDLPGRVRLKSSAWTESRRGTPGGRIIASFWTRRTVSCCNENRSRPVQEEPIIGRSRRTERPPRARPRFRLSRGEWLRISLAAASIRPQARIVLPRLRTRYQAGGRAHNPAPPPLPGRAHLPRRPMSRRRGFFSGRLAAGSGEIPG
jgi:hypothetical protein